MQDQINLDLNIFKKEGFIPFYDNYNKHLLYKGKETLLFDGIDKYTGFIKKINQTGELVFILENGEEKTFLSGDISTKNHI